jgi:hypothetical protein
MNKNMVMGHETRNVCLDEGQQQFPALLSLSLVGLKLNYDENIFIL